MDASIMRELTSDQLKTDLPNFSAGDTLRIHVRVIEGDKERIQVFEDVPLSSAREVAYKRPSPCAR